MEGRNSPSLAMQHQDVDMQTMQTAIHNRSRPTSLYQSSIASAAPSPTAAQFGHLGGVSSPSPYQSQFMDAGHRNGGANGGFPSVPPSPATPSSLQALHESMAAKERANTVALMKERLARMKSQTMTSSQMAIQQLQQAGDQGGSAPPHAGGNGSAPYY